MSLKNLKSDWDDLGEMDPLYAIATWENKKFNRWNWESFLKTGDIEIANIWESLKKLDRPKNNYKCLDFGCGAGRLTHALANYFDEVVGVDVSDNMLDLAKKNNRNNKCKYIANYSDDLKIFADDHFDMIYSNVVLQHLPKRTMIENYIKEFLRILKKDGILVFQLPHYIPLYKRIQPKMRLYHLLLKIGFNKNTVYKKFNLHPMRMNFINENKVKTLIIKNMGEVLSIEIDSNAGSVIKSRTYFITK
jgi:ubiquinone/menaquinone biosynthesis C-methylase UbiE